MALPRWCKLAPGHYAKARRLETASLCCAVTSIAGALLATVGHDALTAYVRSGLVSQFVLSGPDAGNYKGWVDSRDPSAGTVHSNYYFYNCTNPQDVVTSGAKPVLEEVGPLRYVYRNRKFNVSWESGGSVVSYKEYQYYEPADDATRALQDQTITTLDVLLMAALNPAGGLADFIPLVYPQTLDPMSLFTQKTMKEMLFGYTDYLPASFPGLQPNDTSVEQAIAQHSSIRMYTGALPDAAAGGGSVGGRTAGGTGSKAYEYVEWDGMQSLTCCHDGPAGEAGSVASGQCVPVWDTYDAVGMRGTFGSNWHMGIDPSETLSIATYDFGILRHWPLQCRNVGAGPGPGALDDGSDLTAGIGGCNSYEVEGISVLRFDMPDWVLGNASVSADEAAGYGIDGPSGVLNQTLCNTYAPIFLSFPHFLNGSPGLLDGVVGVTPADPDVHGTWIGVEPITGQALNFQFRIGINAHVQPMTVNPSGVPVTYFENVKPVYYPLAWGEQVSSATPDQAEQLRSSLYVGVKALVAFRWGGTALAAAAMAVALLLKFLAYREHVAFEKGVGASLLAQDAEFSTGDGEEGLLGGRGGGGGGGGLYDDDVLLYAPPTVGSKGGGSRRGGLGQRLLN
jgi:hypothetical protein